MPTVARLLLALATLVGFAACDAETVEPETADLTTFSTADASPEPPPVFNAPSESAPEFATPDDGDSDVPSPLPTVVMPTVPRPTTPALPTGPPVVTVGVAEPADGFGLRITLDSYYFDPCLNEFFQADPGWTYLVAEFTVANHSYPGVATYSVWDFVLHDDAGDEYIGSTTHCFFEEEGGPALEQGVTTTTLVPFHMPGDAEGLAIEYDGEPVFSQGGLFRFVVE